MKMLAAAAVLMGTATAHAQPGNVEPAPQPQYYAHPIQHDTVDPDTALGLSLGGTVASWAMLVAGSKYENGALGTAGALGTLLAPSFGHWYAHDGLTRGLGLRLLGLGSAAIGLSMALDGIFDEESSDNDGGAAAGLMLVGMGLYAVGTIDDIATAPSAARKYNDRFELLGVVPTMNPHGGGVALTGRF